MDSQSEIILRKYLLDQLAEEERVEIERRVMVDQSFLEQALIVEDELIDGYLEGNASERDEVWSHFFSIPSRRQKLRVAMGLRKSRFMDHNTKESDHFIERTSRLWRRVLIWGSA